MTEYTWPWQYNFPPFYTLQPNSDTRRKQLDAWSSLILSYCKHHKLHELDVAEISSSELFHNKAIQRRLSTSNIVQILDALVKQGHVEWQDLRKKSCLVMWRTPEEWGKLIYEWAAGNGLTNTVCTFYEIINGDDTKREEFHGIENWLLQRALNTLADQRKAEIIELPDSNGVKFFS